MSKIASPLQENGEGGLWKGKCDQIERKPRLRSYSVKINYTCNKSFQNFVAFLVRLYIVMKPWLFPNNYERSADVKFYVSCMSK